MNDRWFSCHFCVFVMISDRNQELVGNWGSCSKHFSSNFMASRKGSAFMKAVWERQKYLGQQKKSVHPCLFASDSEGCGMHSAHIACTFFINSQHISGWRWCSTVRFPRRQWKKCVASMMRMRNVIFPWAGHLVSNLGTGNASNPWLPLVHCLGCSHLRNWRRRLTWSLFGVGWGRTANKKLCKNPWKR